MRNPMTSIASNLLPPHQVSATLHTVALTLQCLRPRGISSAQALRNSRITEDMVKQPGDLITRAQELTVFANALECSGATSIGLEIGAAMHLPSYGILGYTMMVSPTLGQALLRGMQFPTLFGSYFQLALRIQKDIATLTISGYHYRGDLELMNTDMCVASMWALICDVMGQRRHPWAVNLSHAAPGHRDAYATLLHCEPTFNAVETSLCFPSEWLDQALQFAEPVSCHMATQQCEQLEREWSRAAGDSLMARVLRLLYTDPKRYSSLDAVASALCLSGRTLRRHLKTCQSNFQSLLDQAMHDRALEYLHKTQLPIAEISDRLGYSEPSSFRQAFRRWTQQTPSRVRRKGQ